MPGSSIESPSLKFPDQNPVCTSSFPYTCYMPCPSHSYLSPELYLVRCTEHKALCYVVFSTARAITEALWSDLFKCLPPHYGFVKF